MMSAKVNLDSGKVIFHCLCASLRLYDVVVTYNRYVLPRWKLYACMPLERLAYPCRYSDMVARFGRPVPALSIIFHHMVKTLDSSAIFIKSISIIIIAVK